MLALRHAFDGVNLNRVELAAVRIPSLLVTTALLATGAWYCVRSGQREYPEDPLGRAVLPVSRGPV
ncbi:hypothetical protein GCM10009789_50080 [Kribbella sancticallisti]|uniref:Uncharacterized protein n=1 Tax=Kribbella sancticallisti TaxID=460087 RepID=A0ABN2E1F9_9ACTN